MPEIRKRLQRPATPEDRKRHARVRAQAEREKPAVQALVRNLYARQAQLKSVVAALRTAREAAGLSLQEVGDLSGIGKSNLARLESDRNPNPKIDTLARYAAAVGKDLVLTLQ